MTLEIEYLPLKSLKAYERNSRTHGDVQVELLVNSIREFGFVNPVLVDENNVVIAGHGRLMAAERIPLDNVPAIRLVNLSESRKKALRIADNKIALHSGWDFEKLGEELSELAMDDYDLGITGFSDNEIDSLLKEELSILPEWVNQSTLGDTARDIPQQVDGELVPLGPSVAQVSSSIKKMIFSSYQIPLTEREFEFMEKRVREYLDDNGTLAGFVERNWFAND
jgi:hypothetical protein